MKKTEKVFDDNDNLIGEFDYLDYNEFIIKILTGEVSGPFYVENEYGGKDLIDEYGCVKHYRTFSIVPEQLHKIIQLQMVVEYIYPVHQRLIQIKEIIEYLIILLMM